MSDGPLLMTAVSCHGNETSLSQCPHSDRMVMPCQSDAGVICFQQCEYKNKMGKFKISTFPGFVGEWV